MKEHPARNRVRSLLVVLFVLALLASRGCALGSRPLHHDESLFGYYSYLFATTNFYEYDPVLHGPFLIELTAAVFRLFGDSDTTLRLVPFLSGVAVFALLLALRPWLGSHGTLLALLLLLVSPNLCYYSRFLRNDVLFLLLTLLNLAAIAHTLRTYAVWPLVIWPVSFALLISTKENVIFLAASQLGFAMLWTALDDRRIVAAARSSERFGATAGDRAVHALKMINVSLILWCVVAWIYSLYFRWRIPLGLFAPMLWLVGVATTAALLDAILRAARRNPQGRGLVFRLYRRVFRDPYWTITGLALAVAALCFTYSICLTQPRPLLSLARRAILYWWSEHSSQRLGGPFHCYAPQIALYEAPALAIVLAALLRDWAVNRRARKLEVGLWLAAAIAVWATSLWDMSLRPGQSPVVMAGPIFWTLYDLLSHRLRTCWDYLHVGSLGALFWAASVAYWGAIWTVRSIRRERPFRAWLIFWLTTSYLLYGYAGEKVPWLALHILLPLWLLAALLWNEWRESKPSARRCAFTTALVAALLAWNAWQTYLLCFAHPTNPAELAVFNHTQPDTKNLAWIVARWIENGEVSHPSSVAIQGEASWPLIWYFRRDLDVRFVEDDYLPTRTDEIVIADPGMEERSAMLRSDFIGYYFELRSAWVPPPIAFNSLLCLRPLWDEPDRPWARMAHRLRHSAAILRTLGEYVLFRRAFAQIPPPPDDQPFGTVYSIMWVRQRESPEPLLPPQQERAPRVDRERNGLPGRTVALHKSRRKALRRPTGDQPRPDKSRKSQKFRQEEKRDHECL